MAYDIRLLRLDEKDILVEFLKNCWKKDHIFVQDPNILDFQHKALDHYSFVGAIEIATGELHGVLGFISPSFYSQRKFSNQDDIWLAVWKVDKSKAKNASIGLEMHDYISQKLKPKSISGIGINVKVLGIYKLLGYKVGTLNHVYMLNDNLNKFKIAQINNNFYSKIATDTDINYSSVLRKINWTDEEIDQAIFNVSSPDKDFEYVKNRFANHPYYSYELLALEELFDSKKNVKSYLVSRTVAVNDSQVCRIIDVFGIENISLSDRAAFRKFLTNTQFEYIDLVADTVSSECFINAGFKECTKEAYVPHLFEPYEQSKYLVNYAVLGNSQLSIFKGDSDLDRPSLAKIK